MTFSNEMEKLKAQIQELQEKLQKLEEIEKQPRMNLQQEGKYAVVSYNGKTYYRLEGEVTFSWYIKKDERIYYVPTLVMVEDAETERLLEGIYYNHIQVKKEKVVEEPEENEWKSVALRFGEKLSGYLSDGYYELSPSAWFRWAVFTYGKGQQIKDAVRESVKWCEENPDKDPLDWLKPQTPEQVSDGLKEAFREAVKQGIVSSVDEPTKPMNEVLDRLENKYENDDVVNRMLKKWEENPPDFLKFELGRSLEALITRWWDDVYDGIHQDWDREVAIDDLIDQIQLWLPKSQSSSGTQSASVIDLVDGYNDALTKIKSKLRNKK